MHGCMCGCIVKAALLLGHLNTSLVNGVLSVCRGTTFPVDHMLVSWL